MASKICDSCKTATATVYCRADTAFLCISCDAKIHAANKLASRHARVWVCEVCEQVPAHVTCKADAAALCVACDRDIHSANPLARRHERVPITPFFEPVVASSATPPPSRFALGNSFLVEDSCFSDEEEAEAASWLLPNPNSGNANVVLSSKIADVLGEMEPYMDLGYTDQKDEEEESRQEQSSYGSDGVVPVQNLLLSEMDLPSENCADLSYGTCISHHSVSLSPDEVRLVPEEEMSNNYGELVAAAAMPLSVVDREARVMRYREKRKSRKFEKTIRYASRKAYAETRPRIKGRFAKRVDLDIDLDLDLDHRPSMIAFGVVPSF